MSNRTIEIDDIQAVLQAAESGDAQAQHDAAQYYFNNDENKDVKKAVYWFERAAEQSHPSALHMLGYFYLGGIGVAPDLKKGYEYTLSAAEKGDNDAKYNLGYCYFNGAGTPVDYDKAFHWYSQAAEADDLSDPSEAYFSLGYCYNTGSGTKTDHDKASEYIKKAADLGNEEAAKFLKKHYKFSGGKYVKRLIPGLF